MCLNIIFILIGGAPNYFPNSFNGPREEARALEARHPMSTSVDCARFNSADEDNFTQAGIFWNKVLYMW